MKGNTRKIVETEKFFLNDRDVQNVFHLTICKISSDCSENVKVRESVKIPVCVFALVCSSVVSKEQNVGKMMCFLINRKSIIN